MFFLPLNGCKEAKRFQVESCQGLKFHILTYQIRDSLKHTPKLEPRWITPKCFFRFCTVKNRLSTFFNSQPKFFQFRTNSLENWIHYFFPNNKLESNCLSLPFLYEKTSMPVQNGICCTMPLPWRTTPWDWKGQLEKCPQQIQEPEANCTSSSGTYSSKCELPKQ